MELSQSGIAQSSITQSGMTQSGASIATTESGVVQTDIITVQTGSINNSGTLIANSGSIGSIEIKTLFPEIISTIQHPTNAVFSGGNWYCATGQICRINITFDPIFTGSYLSKNFSCEIITETGSLPTCNPNTFYFSTGSTVVFRLTSRIDTTKSVQKTWNVIFESITATGNSLETITSSGASFSGEISTQ